MTRYEQTSEERLEEAMDWFLRLNEPTCTTNDETAFTLWLNSAAENRQAWAKANRTWEVMGAIAPANAAPSQNSLPPGRRRSQIPAHARKTARPGTISIAIAALAACLVAVIAAPSILIRHSADYVTATAEVRKITLEDGSTVELAAASAIAVDFSSRGRQIRLLSGQAFFDVSPDASRPFTVRTDALDVTVVGTAFDVNITPETETVQLAHGVVNLSDAKGQDIVRMSAGDTITLERSSGRLVRAAVDVDSIASWRDRRLFVQDVPISAMIAELQRYHRSWITLASIELGDRRVTGLYDLSDPDRALEALVTPFGGKVHHVSPYLRVLALF